MRGFTLVELMVTMAIFALLLAIMAPNLKLLGDPLGDATQQVEGALKQTRLKAMSNTMAVRVLPQSATRLKVESATNCAATTWTAEPAFERTLPKGIIFKTTAWSVCFDGRGIADNNAKIDLHRQSDGLERHIEVLLGGAVVGP